MSKWTDENGKITRAGKFAIVTYTIIGALFVISIIDYNSKKATKQTQKVEEKQEEIK